MLRRILPICAATLFLATAPSPADAGTAPRQTSSTNSRARATRRPSRKALRRARRLFKQASRAYSAGKYSKAADLFLQIHAIVGDPALLYNAADAFEKARVIPKAVANYQAYLAAKPNAPDRKPVEAKITAMKNTEPSSRPANGQGRQPVGPAEPGKPGRRRSSEAGTHAGGPTGPNPSRPHATAPRTASKARPETTEAGSRAARKVAGETPEQTAPMPRPRKRQSRLITAGWALVGTTALLLTAMGVTALKMEDAEDQMRRLAIMVDPSTESRLTYEGTYKSDFERYERQGRLYEKLTWGFAAAAGAAAVSAVVLFSLHAVRSRKERQKVSVSPVLGRKQGGLVLETRF